jgi:hypothetical protein
MYGQVSVRYQKREAVDWRSLAELYNPLVIVCHFQENHRMIAAGRLSNSGVSIRGLRTADVRTSMSWRDYQIFPAVSSTSHALPWIVFTQLDH